MDIVAIAGRNKAHQLLSPYVTVTDGLLRIEFRRIVGEPCVAYISIGGEVKDANIVEREYFQHIDSGAPGLDYGM